jgi:hypothetical protein
VLTAGQPACRAAGPALALWHSLTFFTLSTSNTFSSGSFSTLPARPFSEKKASLILLAEGESCRGGVECGA